MYIVGIAGGSASGKTTFLHQLQTEFTKQEVCIISQDDYYYTVDKQQTDTHGYVNYDLPTAIDNTRFIQDIKKLSEGKTVSQKEYVFNNPNKEPTIKLLEPAKIVVVEGLFIFWFEEIANLLNLKVFIDAREDIKYQRRLSRDANERAIPEETILHQWHYHVYPAYKRYLLPFRDEADVIVTNNYNYKKGFEIITHHLRAVLAK